jgi:hypothetical protein
VAEDSLKEQKVLPKTLFVETGHRCRRPHKYGKRRPFRGNCRSVFTMPAGSEMELTSQSSANSIFRISSATLITIDFEVPGSMRIIAARLSGKTGRCKPSGFPPLCRDGCQGSKFQDQAGKSVADAYPFRAEVSS